MRKIKGIVTGMRKTKGMVTGEKKKNVVTQRCLFDLAVSRTVSGFLSAVPDSVRFSQRCPGQCQVFSALSRTESALLGAVPMDKVRVTQRCPGQSQLYSSLSWTVSAFLTHRCPDGCVQLNTAGLVRSVLQPGQVCVTNPA